MIAGTGSLTIVAACDLQPAVWDPGAYVPAGQGDVLGHFVGVSRPAGFGGDRRRIGDALEYRHIAAGDFLDFAIEAGNSPSEGPAVPGCTLLFGTMRAYLGNIVVTPDPAWLGEDRDVVYGVKSEFVVVDPLDGLSYFWWAYLRSPAFLGSLPLGAGGTRPRLQPGALAQVAVQVPALAERARIHASLLHLAERVWRARADLIKALGEMRSDLAR